MLQVNDTKNSFLKLSSLVKKRSQSVNCHDHSKANLLPTGKETAERLLTLANFTEYVLSMLNTN